MKTNMKRLTKKESEYVFAMFHRKVRTIGDLGVGEVVLFMENREEQPKTKWPLDHSITEKFLRFHKLPVKTTLKQYEKRYLRKLQKAEDKEMEANEELAIRLGVLAGN